MVPLIERSTSNGIGHDVTGSMGGAVVATSTTSFVPGGGQVSVHGRSRVEQSHVPKLHWHEVSTTQLSQLKMRNGECHMVRTRKPWMEPHAVNISLTSILLHTHRLCPTEGYIRHSDKGCR